MRNFRQLAAGSLLIALLGLQGCVGIATNTTTLVVKSADREDLRPLAELGDALAQFELGKSYCCMGPGFDTQTATVWLCKSARQGNTDAMYELGRIYQGDVSRSPAPGQKLMRALKAQTSMTHAMMWLALAAQMEHTEAADELADLEANEEISLQNEAMAMLTSWRNQACEYQQVFPDHADN